MSSDDSGDMTGPSVRARSHGLRLPRRDLLARGMPEAGRERNLTIRLTSRPAGRLTLEAPAVSLRGQGVRATSPRTARARRWRLRLSRAWTWPEDGVPTETEEEQRTSA